VEHQNEHRMEACGAKGVSRSEVLDGPTGRRRWPDDVKARIVAESYLPGARVCDVAAKYGLIARHGHRAISPANTARPWTARVAVNLVHPNFRTISIKRAS